MSSKKLQSAKKNVRAGVSYPLLLAELKEKIRQARYKAVLAVNTELVKTYWSIGQAIFLLEKEQGWGSKTIEKLSSDLRNEFPDMKGLSARNLRYMRDLVLTYPHFPILQPVVAKLPSKPSKAKGAKKLQPLVAKTSSSSAKQTASLDLTLIPWSHHTVILDRCKSAEERLFYIAQTIENGWSKSVLTLQIESKLFTRSGKAISNFKTTLPATTSDLAEQTFKNPYVFEFLAMDEKMKERDLERSLIAHLKDFMLELGKGFAYVGNQKNIVVDGDDFFLDLLFYNYNLHCFVVFELKIGEFVPEFAGKLNFYVNTIDGQLKGENDNPTIGVLLCKTPNETVVKYSLQGIKTPIGVAEYKSLPKELKKEMPSLKELEEEMEKESKEFEDPLEAGVEKIKSLLGNLKGEKAQKRLDQESTLLVFDSALSPLYNRILNLLNAKLAEYFERIEAHIHSAGPLETDVIKARQHLASYSHQLQEISISFSLKGCKQAGIHAFNIDSTVFIRLDEYKYTCYTPANRLLQLVKLYHQHPSSEELDEFSKEFCKILVDETAQRLEEILSKNV